MQKSWNKSGHFSPSHSLANLALLIWLNEMVRKTNMRAVRLNGNSHASEILNIPELRIQRVFAHALHLSSICTL